MNPKQMMKQVQQMQVQMQQRMSELRAEGSALTDSRIRELWAECGQPFYGPDVQMPDRWGLHWALVPHIVHERFYCYAYVFGQLLVLALYRTYQEEGSPFVPKFMRLLESGGSDTPSGKTFFPSITRTPVGSRVTLGIGSRSDCPRVNSCHRSASSTENSSFDRWTAWNSIGRIART